MVFVRNDSQIWRQRVPGVRWFKGDLHLHTIDDHLGGRAKVPSGIIAQLLAAEIAAGDSPMTTTASAGPVGRRPRRRQGVTALSDNTRRVYGAQWRLFNDWCGDVGLPSLPAEPLTVARYLAARAGDGASIATLRLATSAIGKAHEWAKQESPCRDPGVRASMKGSGGKTPVEASATVAEPR